MTPKELAQLADECELLREIYGRAAADAARSRQDLTDAEAAVCMFAGALERAKAREAEALGAWFAARREYVKAAGGVS